MLKEALSYDPASALARQHLIAFLYEAGQTEEAIEEIKRLVETMGSRTEDYACSKCGYRSTDVLWRCPKCQSWETFLQYSSTGA